MDSTFCMWTGPDFIEHDEAVPRIAPSAWSAAPPPAPAFFSSRFRSELGLRRPWRRGCPSQGCETFIGQTMTKEFVRRPKNENPRSNIIFWPIYIMLFGARVLLRGNAHADFPHDTDIHVKIIPFPLLVSQDHSGTIACDCHFFIESHSAVIARMPT